MRFELNNLIFEELVESLKSAKVGVIVRGLIEVEKIEIGSIVSAVSAELGHEIYLAAVGYDIQDASQNVIYSSNIEDAVHWRNSPELAGKIVVIVQDEVAKMHSLADFDVLTPRDIVNRLLNDAQNVPEQNEPQRNFWQALQHSLPLLQLDMLLEFVQTVFESDDLNAISDNLWRLGLLRDTRLLNADKSQSERLARNRGVLLDMEQLSDASKKRMKAMLTRTSGDERDELRIAYRLLMRFYSTGERNVLQQLELDTVELLLKSGKPKRQDGEDDVEQQPDVATPSQPLSGRELERSIADLVVAENDESEEQLRELGDSIREYRDKPQEASDDLALSGREVRVSFIPDRLMELIEIACMNGSWGGYLLSNDTDLKTITSTWERGDFTTFSTNGEQELFGILLGLEQDYLDPGVFSEPIDQLLEARDTLLDYLDLLVNYPMVLFGGYSEARTAVDSYLDAFSKLLRNFRHNETTLHREDSLATRKAAQFLLMLDVIYIQTPDEWKAILTPLHPLHLWRYREIVVSLMGNDEREFSGEERQQLANALPDIPHLLHFIIVSPTISDRNDVVLPQSGNLGFLPTYENRTNRYLGTDGVDFLHTLMKQWLTYAPYSRNQLRIALVDVPDLPYAVRLMSKYLKENDNLQLITSVYSTSGRDYQIELARLDYDDKDHHITEAMRAGRLKIVLHSAKDIGEIVEAIADSPVHIAYAFDQAKPKMEKSPRAHQLIVSPLVITYEYEYSPRFGRGTITPSSAAEDGIFGDYYFIVERAGQLPPDTELRLKFGEDVNIEPFNRLLETGCVRWLAIADRVLTAYYAPESGIPLGERRIGQREVAVWALKSSRTVQRFIELLRRYNLRPDDDVVIEMIKRFGHISSEGILGLPSIVGNAVVRAAQEKGLLGTLLAAKWYTTIYPDALIASLDTDLAKNWLQGRITTNERADLMGVRTLPDGRIVIEPIEVKTRQSLSSDEVKFGRDKITGQRRLSGHAVEQLLSIVKTLQPVFGGTDKQPLFTPARRETLKYQLYRECFREVHDEDWRHEWYKQLQYAFSEGQEQVHFHGMVLHLQLEDGIEREVISDEIEPISFVRIGSKEIQKLIEPGGEERLNPLDDYSPVHSRDTGISTTEDIITEDVEWEPATSDEEAIQADIDNATNRVEIADREVGSSFKQQDENEFQEIRQLARLFLRSCESFRIQVEECDPQQAKLGPNVWRLYIKLASGQSLRPLQTHLEDIGREMRRSGLLVSPIPNSDRIALDIPRSEREIVLFEHAISWLPEIQSPEQMPILLGVTPEGEHIVRYLDQMPHLLVGGTTGSGKTIFLYSILASLLYTHKNPQHLRLFMSSSGLEDFVFFNELPHLEAGQVLSEAAEALLVLNDFIIPEFERRERILTEARSRNISEYNQRSKVPLPPLVLVVDEFADLSDQLAGDRVAKQQFHDNIRRIAQLGRKRGVHLVLCTQRPSADLVPTNIRSLLNARVALRVNDGAASRMILDDTGAEHLQFAGDILFKEEAVVTRAQSYFVSRETIEDIVGDVQ